ncbi:hypothetical protein [Stenotrophomonas phage BUCT627]|uniref:Uncharacterized protein n=2 Tax=Bixiavirus TaxID=3044676 RepID=A0AC61NA10_9CAUD|nr:hypothetical protein PQD76_gp18 [Stenotrophomonas phage BUCT626]YP_010677504.1 hypothetical protein PQD77_gp055 [Stenotrophomonas phage BUCT627]QYC96704.1 hypothetical protein [Stenotrophomonas phage BUCT627]QYC96722.1 hypothetical protein [Stenotrophomonas phage BUCT626]
MTNFRKIDVHKHETAGRYLIEGRHYSVNSFVAMAKDRGVTIHRSTILSRLKGGCTTIDSILAPPDKGKQTGSLNRHQREREEMAKLIAQMGPRKRY